MQIKICWNGIIDKYLDGVEKLFFVLQNYKNKAESGKLNHPLPSRTLFKFTAIGIFVALIFVLMSCTSRGLFANRKRSFFMPQVPKTDKLPTDLYVKSEDLEIKNKDIYSHSGSLWADAQRPREFFLDFRPPIVGDIVTLNIPASMQFQKATAKDKPNTAKDAANTRESVASPDAVGVQAAMADEPIQSFKMRVEGVLPDGSLMLRGSRNYNLKNGNNRNVYVSAKVPALLINGSQVKAEDVTDVDVQEDDGTGMQDQYLAQGWDKMVSRRLAGFVPDIDAELGALNGVRQELMGLKNSLDDRSKAIAQREKLVDKSSPIKSPTDNSAASKANVPDATTPAPAPTNPPPVGKNK